MTDPDRDLRQCVARLGPAFASLLGKDPGPALANRYRDFAGLARELAGLCDDRATEIDHIHPHTGYTP